MIIGAYIVFPDGRRWGGGGALLCFCVRSCVLLLRLGSFCFHSGVLLLRLFCQRQLCCVPDPYWWYSTPVLLHQPLNYERKPRNPTVPCEKFYQEAAIIRTPLNPRRFLHDCVWSCDRFGAGHFLARKSRPPKLILMYSSFRGIITPPFGRRVWCSELD